MIYKSAPGEKVFVSWSGGKDSYLCLLRAVEQGLDVVCLLSFVGEDGLSRSHGLKREILSRQAKKLGLTLETETVSWQSYEAGFERAVKRLKKELDIGGGVFGDINLEDHRRWVEKMCTRCGIDYNLPLWGMEERKVSEELVKRGGKALLVAVRRDLVEERWLGYFLDEKFAEYCEKIGVSPCGEGGEAHTLVVDGPMFKEPLGYRTGPVKRLERHALLEISVD